MALQGTIDAFPLTDVLSLLAASAKSGSLALDGDRGRSELWIENGEVVGASSGTGAGAELLVFELLRFKDGSYVFGESKEVAAVSVAPVSLAECLDRAGELIEEWRKIESVVPSSAHRVSLVPELTEESVTLSSADWAVVVAVGDSPEVATVGARLALDELSAGALLAALCERGILMIDEPSTTPASARHGLEHLAVEPAEVEPPEVGRLLDTETIGSIPVVSRGHVDRDSREEFPERFPIDDLLGDGTESGKSWDETDTIDRFAAAQTFEPSSGDTFIPFGGDLNERTAEAWDDVVAGIPGGADDSRLDRTSAGSSGHGDEGTEEVLRQMSRLSPQAAEAIAAALSAPAPADAPTSAPDDGGNDDSSPFLGML